MAALATLKAGTYYYMAALATLKAGTYYYMAALATLGRIRLVHITTWSH